MNDRGKPRAPSIAKGVKTGRSLTGDLVISLAALMTVVSVLAISANAWRLARHSKRQFELKSNEYLTYLQDSLVIPMWNYDEDGIKRVCTLFLKNDLVHSIKITDSIGGVLFEAVETASAAAITRKEPVTFADQTAGWIEIGLTNRVYEESFRQLVSSSLLTFLLIIMTLVFFCTLFLNYFLRTPLQHLIRRIDRAADGEYAREPVMPKQRELVDIISRFNLMAENIQKRENALNRMNASLIDEINERRQVEKALRESELRFRSFFNSSPEGVVIADLDGRVLDINKSLMKITGYEMRDVMRRHIADFAPHEKRDNIVRVIEMIKSGIADDDPIETACLKKDGAAMPVRTRAWVVADESSRPMALGIFIRDITKEKSLASEKALLEKQLRQTQKMEAIGTLSGGIAHDFNNILGGVMGYAELALEKASGENAKVRRYLDQALKGCNRARDLVRQILQFSRRESEILRPVYMKPLFKEAVKLIRATLPATIRIEHRADLTCDRVMADATQLHQVMMNLFTNAYHAVRDAGGLLSATLENVRVTESRRFMSMCIPPGDYVKLSVSDSGPGMPAEIRDRVFEPYFTTKKADEGTGLGLSVTFGIVANHNGLIEIEKTSDEGTVMAVYLPVTTAEQTSEAATAPAAAPGNGEKILIVDDEAFFRDVLREYLKGLGYRPAAFPSGPPALAALQGDPAAFDLIITDQTMPEMTGTDLIEKVRKLRRDIPVILCTGFSETVSEQTAAHYGVGKFLLKPVTRKTLALAVRELLSNRANNLKRSAM